MKPIIKVAICLFLFFIEFTASISAHKSSLVVFHKLSAQAERGSKLGDDDLKTKKLKNDIKAEIKKSFHKSDFALIIGIEGEIDLSSIDSKLGKIRVPFQVRFGWDVKGKFKTSLIYPNLGKNVDKSKKKSGYSVLVEENDKPTVSKDSKAKLEQVKKMIIGIAEKIGVALLKWAMKTLLKAFVLCFIPALAPLVIVYDVYSFIKKLKGKIEDTKTPGIKKASVQYNFFNIEGLLGISGVLAIEYPDEALQKTIGIIKTWFQDHIKNKLDYLKKKWAQFKQNLKAQWNNDVPYSLFEDDVTAEVDDFDKNPVLDEHSKDVPALESAANKASLLDEGTEEKIADSITDKILKELQLDDDYSKDDV